jgi:antitoxin ParD1/3/4
MPKMSLELTDSLQSFVDSESSQQGFASSTDFVIDLIKKEQDRAHVRALIDEGMASPSRVICVEEYINSLRNKINGKKDL